LKLATPLIALAATAFAGLLALPASAADPPKGHLLIIGGGVRGPEIMGKFVELAGGARARVAVFPMASSTSAETGRELATEMRGLGIADVRVLDLTRAQADTPEAVAQLDGVTGVYFAGGDQSRLTAALLGSRVEARLHAIHSEGGVLSGTSAGAAVMSRVMITGEERRPLSKDDAFQTVEAGDIVTSTGFGFLEGAIVDQHFVRRRRHNRLLALVLENPRLVGIGIDEGTAVWVKPDRTFEVLGAGPVVVYDATAADVRRDADGPGLRASGLTLHVLRRGARYDLGTRAVVGLGP
jgi:cyanophycinase